MFILTDFPTFPVYRKAADGTPVRASTLLASFSARDTFLLLAELRNSDVILIQESKHILGFSFLFWVLPFFRKPIIAVDLILRTPHTFKQKLVARLKRVLLNRIDHFIFYFHDLSGYQAHYGISSDRSSYVPFKSNMHGNSELADAKPVRSEEYVFSAGRSLRDFDTLFAALSRLSYPAAIPKPDVNQLQKHGARFTWKLEELPKNLVLLDDDGSKESWIRNLSRAKVVVIPTLQDNLCASGIGTYLDAMYLGKCVVISGGPGVSELLRDEAIIVPPEDAGALAAAIERVWEDATLRTETASRGHRYAQNLGGEAELMDRLAQRVLDCRRKLRSFAIKPMRK